MFHNDEAEQYVLSAIINEPDTLYDLETILNEDDFYYEAHKTIFKSVRQLFTKNAYDVRALVHTLRTDKQLEEVGGMEYISRLRIHGGRRLTAKVYADKIKELSVYRSADRIARQLQDEVQLALENGDASEFISKVHGLFNSFDVIRENKMRHVSQAVQTAEAQSKETRVSPLLGLSNIDKWMKGVGQERLIVVAGRPGTGKTAFSLGSCRNISSQGVGAVPIFSMEMSAEELVNRMLADMSGVPFNVIMSNEYQGEQENVVNIARAKLAKLPLYIDDTARMDYEYIVSQCRRLKREHGSLGVVMIDYLGLIKVHAKKNQNKADAIGELTGDLKRLTRELGCSIILLVQMNREIEKRGNKRPVMSDLRDSGSIEQDADMVIFLHRDMDKTVGAKYHIDFIVEKGRQTGVADFELWFNGVIQRFEVKG